MNYEAALAFATKKHAGQFRRGGQPYITHPIAVADIVQAWGYGEDYRIAALFHDLLEDTDAAEAELLALSSPEILTAVRLLTKSPGYNMADYIAGIRSHPIAFTVKAADRLHNLRSAICTDDDFKQRYIAESRQWYLDFSPEIPAAIRALEEEIGK